MRLVLLGKSGQLGSALQRSLSTLGQVCAFDRHSDQCADLGNLNALHRDLLDLKPDWIVNAAAYTAVDQAETEPHLARQINAHAPEVMAKVARHLGATLVHYSTDYVFDGKGDRPWSEDDEPQALNVYGQTKREGELAIMGSGCRHLILRSSWIYGVHGSNFVKTILQRALEQEELKVVNDQWGAPTSASWLAERSAMAMRQTQLDPDRLGLYHLVPRGQTNWHAYACQVIHQAQGLRPDKPWKVREVLAVPSSFYPTIAKRPHNSRLSTAKFEKAFGMALPDWSTELNPMLQAIL
jgi:dTDP-4-dehydrorhamnose reductase